MKARWWDLEANEGMSNKVVQERHFLWNTHFGSSCILNNPIESIYESDLCFVIAGNISKLQLFNSVTTLADVWYGRFNQKN